MLALKMLVLVELASEMLAMTHGAILLLEWSFSDAYKELKQLFVTIVTYLLTFYWAQL